MRENEKLLMEGSRRDALVERWFGLTKTRLPRLSKTRDWPVSEDHCFMRIFLDNACEGVWSEQIKSPAYRNASEPTLEQAIALAEAVAEDEADLWALNARSLAWRGKRARSNGN